MPNNCNQYYICATEVTSGNNSIEYFVYDLTAQNLYGGTNAIGELLEIDGQNDPHKTLKQSSLWQKGNAGEDNVFFATTPLKSDNNRYLFISSNDYIYCYDVTPNGIFIDEDKSFTFIPDDLRPNGQDFYLPNNSGFKG